jgi:hypothetical protein
MKIPAAHIVRGSGICVIIAMAFSVTGCGTPARVSMSTIDLNSFQPDCSRRDEQIRMLTSMLNNRDDQFMARLGNALQPWQAVTDPGTYGYRQDVGYGRTNWLIRQNLHILVTQC